LLHMDHTWALFIHYKAHTLFTLLWTLCVKMNFLLQVCQKLSYCSLEMLLVVYLWSLNKDGGHTIWSAVVKNSMIHANLTPLSFTEPELQAIKVLHCGNKDCRLFYFCDPDLDLMTFIYKLDPYSLEIHWMCEYKHTYIHTYIQTNMTEIIYHTTLLVVN